MERVLVTGTFDQLHKGHMGFLREAHTYGNELYVLLASDEIVVRNKGRKPLQNEQERLRALKGLEFVTDVIIDEKHGSIDRAVSLNPTVVVLGFDQQSVHSERLAEYCKQMGIPFYRLAEHDSVHTTHLRPQ